MPDEEFYKDIIDNLYDGVYFVDRERVIIYWNKGVERITGYGADQTVGRSCRDNLLNHVTAYRWWSVPQHCATVRAKSSARSKPSATIRMWSTPVANWKRSIALP